MSNLIEEVRGWAAKANDFAVWMLIVLSAIMVVISLLFLYFDCQTSYLGWGKLIETQIDAGAGAAVLAVAVSVLPTLIQIVYITALFSGVSIIAKNDYYKLLSFLMFTADTFLDFQQLYTEGAMSALIAGAVAIVVYGLLSEYISAFFMPIAYALLSTKFSGMRWNFEERGGSSNGGGKPAPRVG
jgi:hypothetical protein